MEEIKYIGEHLWLGQLGHFLILLSFVGSVFSAFSYYNNVKSGNATWRNMGRAGYIVHGLSLFVVIGLIFYAMVNHMFEYHYVWRTVSDVLPMQYILSAFWADQEGSFMLWMFWHVILGFVLMRTAGKWESSVLTTLALIQAGIGSMLLGLYLPFGEDMSIGSSPFILLRDVMEAPIFSNADYLTLIKGKGLNPLLQNYWMTIHPPVLFLGFASLAIPFCYAVSGLSLRDHKGAMKSVMRWALFSGFIFGLGILMGSAWAYEALTFGGYWAWDPVENSSLAPWLLMIAGIHTNLITNNTGHAYRSTYIYYILAFVFVVYSTFLTRSGILGETSVHAFTTMGLETQLGSFMGFFILLGVFKYLYNMRSIPTQEREEELFSREFWMFIGALVLLFSTLLMTISTSLPVYNKIVELFNPDYIGKVIEDQVEHHNRFQIWIGVFMGLLSGLAILLRYNAFNWSSYKSKAYSHIGIVAIVSAVLTFLIGGQLVRPTWQHQVFLFAGLFTLIANLDYIITFIKGNLKTSGASISHMGFGILIVGMLFSGLNQKTISENPFVTRDFLQGDGANKAIILIKDQPFLTSNYYINYVGDTLVNNLRSYQLDFREVDRNNKTISEFSTFPSAIYSTDFTKIEAVNPGTSHNLTFDVFTQASPPPHLQSIEKAQMAEDSLKYLSYLISPGDTFEEEAYSVEILDFDFDHEFNREQFSDIDDYDMTVAAHIQVTDKRTNKVYEVYPGLGVRDALIFTLPEVIDPIGIKLKLNEESFNDLFTEESDLQYESVNLKLGESIKIGDQIVTLDGFDRSPEHPNYEPKEGDIAVGAQMSVIRENQASVQVNPIYIIQDLQPFSIKDYNADLGMHVRFSHIEPSTGQMTFSIAYDKRNEEPIDLLIAEDVPRSDILIVQADVFPGINLVWLGTLMMLFGILLSLLFKYGVKKSLAT
jgi:cytochrome c-type biogenesis protein CcmF